MDNYIEEKIKHHIDYAIGLAKRSDHLYLGKLTLDMLWGYRAKAEFEELFKQLRARGITEFYSRDESTALLGQLYLLHELGAKFEPCLLEMRADWLSAVPETRVALHITIGGE